MGKGKKGDGVKRTLGHLCFVRKCRVIKLDLGEPFYLYNQIS
jgi:hypothetical protein